MAGVETMAIARKWGNSLGVSLPAELVAKEKIKANDKVIIIVKKARRLADFFGSLKTKKTTQKIKDELRAGWS